MEALRPRPTARVRLAASLAAACVCAAACGGAHQAPAVTPAPRPPLGSLALLLPEGASLVLLAKPSLLMAAPALRRVVDAVAPPVERDAFARRTGVEPAGVEELAVAQYGDGFALLVRGPWPARDVVRAAEQRMNTVALRSDRPFLRRAGWLGAERREVVALGDHVLLVAGEASVQTAAILQRAARGRWPGGQGRGPALAVPALGPLMHDYGRAALLLVVPHPLELPPGFGTSVLLSRERALAATLTPIDPDHLALEVALWGEFPDGAERNFRALVESVASSGLGGALGIADALQTLSVQSEPGSVVVRMRLSSSSLAAGLRTLFISEIRDLLAAPAGSPQVFDMTVKTPSDSLDAARRRC